MMPSLRERATDITELMDTPQCDEQYLLNTYRQFEAINAVISGWRGLYTDYLRPVLQESGPGAKVLDVGCGGGDIMRRLAMWATRDGLTPCFIGADPDERSIHYAQSIPSPANICFVCATAQELVEKAETFDIVLSNHVLHHLTNEEVRSLCVDSATMAQRLVLHADIHRHPLAYASFPLIGGWFQESFILQDGLRSIRRAFTPQELTNLVPDDWKVKTAFPFRLHLVWNA